MLIGTKDKLAQQIDHLAFDDPHYDRKFQDLQDRQNAVYDEIALAESELAETQQRIENVQKNRLSVERIYEYLKHFDKLYDKMSDLEKKEFMNSFIERVEIFPEKQPDGRILKHIDFKFPVYYNGQKFDSISWEPKTTDETVVLMLRVAEKGLK